VQATTVFEAACRASAIFKHSVVEDPTWAAEFVVEVKEQPRLSGEAGPDAEMVGAEWQESTGIDGEEKVERTSDLGASEKCS
jgi:hypothetical protein